jgi:hypothetical protein
MYVGDPVELGRGVWLSVKGFELDGRDARRAR